MAPVRQPRTCPVLSPPQGLGQHSRIQPMSKLCVFHEDLSHRPSHRHSWSHVCLQRCAWELWENTNSWRRSLLNFLLLSPCPWSLCIFASREDCRTAGGKRGLQGGLALASKSMKAQEEWGGSAGKESEPSLRQEERDLRKITNGEGFLPKPKATSPSWREQSNERCSSGNKEEPRVMAPCGLMGSRLRAAQKGACAPGRAVRWQRASCTRTERARQAG